MDIKDLLAKRATLVNNARAILDKAKAENRDPTADEQRQFDGAMADVDKIKAEIEEKEKAARRQQWLDDETKEMDASRGRASQTQRADRANGDHRNQPQVLEFRRRPGVTVELKSERDTPEYQAAFRQFLATGMQQRALQQDSDTKGGFLTPERFSAEILMELDDIMWMRQICRVLPPVPGATSIGQPSLDTDPDDADWTVELGTGDEDSSMAFGKRSMATHPLAKRIKVSKTLVRVVPNIDTLIRSRLAYKVALPQEKAFLTGHGAQQPLGVFTASDQGISTSRDVSTGNAQTEIRFDGLIEAEYAIKAQYRRNLEWIFHRTGIKQIRKLKDGEGRYIWQASVTASAPDTILNHPVHESEWAPSTFTSGLYVGILGNFREYYWILDSLMMDIQVLMELYAETNQNGYIIRAECDGAPVNQNAFARVKLA